jgi:hypothetical protein
MIPKEEFRIRKTADDQEGLVIIATVTERTSPDGHEICDECEVVFAGRGAGNRLINAIKEWLGSKEEQKGA